MYSLTNKQLVCLCGITHKASKHKKPFKRTRVDREVSARLKRVKGHVLAAFDMWAVKIAKKAKRVYAKATKIEKYNPDQPRDKSGEFTSGGVTHRPDGGKIVSTPPKGSKAESRGIKVGSKVSYAYTDTHGTTFRGAGVARGFVHNSKNGSPHGDVAIHDSKRGSVVFVDSKNVRSLVRKADDDEDLVLSILNELQINDVSVDVVEGLTPEITAMFKDAGVFGVVQVGFEASPDITKHLDKAALKFAEDRSAELVTDLEKSTRDYLRTQVSAAVEDGASAQELADNIQESFAFSASRAETIARTELAFAHVQGNVEGWRETGEVEMKEAILGDNHEIEDECDDAVELGVIPLDDDFGDAGDFPPFHPNCVCDVLPVLTPSGDE